MGSDIEAYLLEKYNFGALLTQWYFSKKIKKLKFVMANKETTGGCEGDNEYLDWAWEVESEGLGQEHFHRLLDHRHHY